MLKVIALYVKLKGQDRDSTYAKIMTNLSKKLFLSSGDEKSCVSDKTFNCLVNAGMDSKTLVHVVHLIKKQTRIDCPIEIIIKDQID